MEKRCTKCGKVKSADTGFRKDASKQDGFYSSCKECNADYLKQYIETNRNAINEGRSLRRKTFLKIPWEVLSKQYTFNPENGIIYNQEGSPVSTRVVGEYLWGNFKSHHCYYPSHRVAWFLLYKEWAIGIDHINGDKLDNRLANLRKCLPRENSNNLPRHREGGLPGAHYRVDRHKWASYTRDKNGRRIYLKHWDTEREASLQYCKYVLKHGLVGRGFLPAEFTDEELGL